MIHFDYGFDMMVIYVYLYIYLIYFVSVCCEICCDTSPKYGGWNRVMDDFDGLSIYDIVAIFSNSWVVCVPFFEVNIDVVVTHFVVFACASTGGSFPPREDELFRFDDNFRYLA